MCFIDVINLNSIILSNNLYRSIAIKTNFVKYNKVKYIKYLYLYYIQFKVILFIDKSLEKIKMCYYIFRVFNLNLSI